MNKSALKDPEVIDAVQKINQIAVEKQMELANKHQPPSSEYLEPVLARPLNGKFKQCIKLIPCS